MILILLMVYVFIFSVFLIYGLKAPVDPTKHDLDMRCNVGTNFLPVTIHTLIGCTIYAVTKIPALADVMTHLVIIVAICYVAKVMLHENT